MIVRRGDIYFADLSPVVGSEQGGIRPVLIIQNEHRHEGFPVYPQLFCGNRCIAARYDCFQHGTFCLVQRGGLHRNTLGLHIVFHELPQEQLIWALCLRERGADERNGGDSKAAYGNGGLFPGTARSCAAIPARPSQGSCPDANYTGRPAARQRQCNSLPRFPERSAPYGTPLWIYNTALCHMYSVPCWRYGSALPYRNSEKKLEFPVKITQPDARLAKIMIEQYGGADGRRR